MEETGGNVVNNPTSKSTSSQSSPFLRLVKLLQRLTGPTRIDNS